MLGLKITINSKKDHLKFLMRLISFSYLIFFYYKKIIFWNISKNWCDGLCRIRRISIIRMVTYNLYTDRKLVAEILNDHYKSVFVVELKNVDLPVFINNLTNCFGVENYLASMYNKFAWNTGSDHKILIRGFCSWCRLSCFF